MCMKFIGIKNISLDEDNINKAHDIDRSQYHRYMARCRFLWCFISVALVWTNILRLLPALAEINGFNEQSFITIVISVWYIQCGINSAVCLRAHMNKNLLTRLFELWSNYCKHCSFAKNATSLRRIVWILVSGYVMFVLCNVALIGYIMYSGDPKMVYFTRVLYTPFGEHAALKVFLLLFQGFIAGTWILPLWLFALVSIISTYILGRQRVLD